MENKIFTEQFCGVDIFNWKEWDMMDTDNFYFYNVEFLLPSMQKYNGMDVGRWFDGKMEIYKDSDPDADESVSDVVWSGYVTDIHEVMEALNREV